jgi:flagellar basal-body rod protein FlgB
MDTKPGLMDLLVQKMSYLNQKQMVHAENVANSDTPGYKARELEPFTFDTALKQSTLSMTATDAGHIIPASMSGANARTTQAKSYEKVASGNSVDSEHEMMQVSKTGVDYQFVTSIYHKIGGLFNIALKGTSSS